MDKKNKDYKYKDDDRDDDEHTYKCKKGFQIHPVYLTQTTKQSRAIFNNYDDNYNLFEDCDSPTESNNKIEYYLAPILTPTDKKFVEIFYNIKSFDDALNIIDAKKTESFYASIRIIKMSFQAYGNKLKIIDPRFTEFFNKYIEKYKLEIIYEYLHSYIAILDDKIKFVNPSENTLKIMDNYIERTNFLIETLYTVDKLTIFIHKYIKFNSSNWKKNDDHIENMAIDLIDYSKKIIGLTINK
jgi:hypothetical protein